MTLAGAPSAGEPDRTNEARSSVVVDTSPETCDDDAQAQESGHVLDDVEIQVNSGGEATSSGDISSISPHGAQAPVEAGGSGGVDTTGVVFNAQPAQEGKEHNKTPASASQKFKGKGAKRRAK